MQFYPFFIEEPDLIFGGQQEEKDPRIGLERHGPYYTEEKKHTVHNKPESA